jgi:hypothetical protein
MLEVLYIYIYMHICIELSLLCVDGGGGKWKNDSVHHPPDKLNALHCPIFFYFSLDFFILLVSKLEVLPDCSEPYRR